MGMREDVGLCGWLGVRKDRWRKAKKREKRSGEGVCACVRVCLCVLAGLYVCRCALNTDVIDLSNLPNKRMLFGNGKWKMVHRRRCIIDVVGTKKTKTWWEKKTFRKL